VATGDVGAARRRTGWDLQIVGALVLVASAFLIALAPQVVAMLFRHGAFTAADVRATAGILRVYSVGLLGQGLLEVVGRSYFSGSRRPRVAVVTMIGALLATLVLSALLVGPFGGRGIAAANAIAISAAALVLLLGLRGGRDGIGAGRLMRDLLRLAVLSALAGLAGALAAAPLSGLPPALVVLLGGVAVALVFIVLLAVAGPPRLRRAVSAPLLRRLS
jgi:putative peptidoglycan lipid II flippase